MHFQYYLSVIFNIIAIIITIIKIQSFFLRLRIMSRDYFNLIFADSFHELSLYFNKSEEFYQLERSELNKTMIINLDFST